MRCFGLSAVEIPESVTEIGSDAFMGCTNLTLSIPSGIREIGRTGGLGIYDHGWPKCVRFEGLPPKGVAASGMLDSREVLVPAEYRREWGPYMKDNMKFAVKSANGWTALGGRVVSCTMRKSNPSIMDIKYVATSTKDRVDVRMMAFQDGERSFAKAIRPVTFADGTESNIGDGIAANVEHTVSWVVSEDWDVELARVSVEVYVQEENLLPLQLTTIPAAAGKPAVTFSRNVQSREKVMNALFWLYADGASDMALANGVLTANGKKLADGKSICEADAVSHVYRKMGYGILSGETLEYVNEIMQTDLNPQGIRQFAVQTGAAD